MHRTPRAPIESATFAGQILLLLGALALQACGGEQARGAGHGAPTAKGALITFEMCAAPGAAPQRLTLFSSLESFIVDAERMADGGARQIPVLDLLPGQGVDPQWDWHVDPETTAFGDFEPALCDGCPADVEANLQYWLTLGQYCPWGASVARVVRTL